MISLEETGYFECHGTGTLLGDFLEVTAIGEVFESVRRPEDPLLIGSVKTNLGHGEATNAISSLIKTVLCLEKGEIPATIGIKKFNPALNFRDGRLKVAQSLTNWPNTQIYRRASVNSLSYGGANAHAILDAAESYLGRFYHTIDKPFQTSEKTAIGFRGRIINTFCKAGAISSEPAKKPKIYTKRDIC